MIYRIPKDRYVEVTEYICDYHKDHPEEKAPNDECGCGSSYCLKIGKKPEGKEPNGHPRD